MHKVIMQIYYMLGLHVVLTFSVLNTRSNRSKCLPYYTYIILNFFQCQPHFYLQSNQKLLGKMVLTL